ncbi:DUF4361 domain-containing protein [Bacteroides faecis]|nr:DUF4361 domain-containing protein [Bacteroides faecis]
MGASIADCRRRVLQLRSSSECSTHAKAILRTFPFNDYSGDYSGTGITNKVVTGYDGDGKPIETAESITKSSIRG